MKIISIILFLLSFPVFADSDWLTQVSKKEIVLDYSKFDVPEDAYTKAALKAFYGRDWNVETIEKDAVTGRLFEKKGISRVIIDLSKKPIISIKYIDDNLAINTSYLHNLGRDMLGLSLSSN